MFNSKAPEKQFEKITILDGSRPFTFEGFLIASKSTQELPDESVNAYFTSTSTFIMQALENGQSHAVEFEQIDEIPTRFGRHNLFMDGLYLKMLMSDMPEWHKLKLMNLLREMNKD